MSSEFESGFVPSGNYSLDDWGPRKRGEWPGPKISYSEPEWRFPEDYPAKEQLKLAKKYQRSMDKLQRELQPQLPDDQRSRVMVELDNAHRQQMAFASGFPLDKEYIERVMDHHDYQDFCWKVCAIYVASGDDTKKKQGFGTSLYEYLDSVCFKGEQTWAFCESFLAKAIHCTPDQARSLSYLTSFHKEICDKVANWCPPCEPLSAEECREKRVGCTEWRPEDHHLLPIFRRLIVIIDEIPTDGPFEHPNFPKSKARLVFTQDERGNMAIDPISIPDLCAKYNVQASHNPSVVTGELDTVLEIVTSLWEQERPHLTYLDPIVEKLQERLKFKVQDIEAFWRGLENN
ncbi:hypothetical protein ASPWEDRAFT_41164 [Aspergillus wentii DTO 134E9]|uniref:Uncharacterized protein n=1 Tax=Aspergillus wentii DTO 134E9 TaxID=1073089 RepID=A0A1L9RLX1_ASPWE|nr:uncharacterized protein ASPWEDRAFT_41164 [Aspergillus wentii DTO 134E9]OJJ35939.1 hypothetical protein ASPWEDRAFT_41164 [Aspergillus wentii DTO 134E9]